MLHDSIKIALLDVHLAGRNALLELPKLVIEFAQFHFLIRYHINQVAGSGLNGLKVIELHQGSLPHLVILLKRNHVLQSVDSPFLLQNYLALLLITNIQPHGFYQQQVNLSLLLERKLPFRRSC